MKPIDPPDASEGSRAEPDRQAPPAKERHGGSPAPPAPVLEVLEIAHGEYPHVVSLNRDFREGTKKLKLTLRITDPRELPRARDLMETLGEFLPSLSYHRCCGSNSLEETFFERGRRRRCAVEGADEGVDIAHLIEHVIIDVQHFVGRMRICSGVTCAYADPHDCYDVFVESPEESVGRASAVLALNLVGDLLDGFRPDPRYLCVMGLARLARDHAGSPIHVQLESFEATWGAEPVAEAMEFLQGQGFLKECPASINFSGRPLLAYVPEEASENGQP
jgi:hypothetical protein